MDVYLIGTKVVYGETWNVDGQPFDSASLAETAAEARTVKTGIEHFVFKPVAYYSRNEITASRNRVY
jgi:hypothetical protein